MKYINYWYLFCIKDIKLLEGYNLDKIYLLVGKAYRKRNAVNLWKLFSDNTLIRLLAIFL